MSAVGYTGGDPSKVDVVGDTMTGPLVLPGDPSLDLQAATKQYVDTHGGGGGGGGIPATTVTSETSFGIAPVVGTGTKYARDDHTHGSPATPTPAGIGAATSGHNHSGTYDPAGSAQSAFNAAVAAIPASGGTVVGETTYSQGSSAGAAATWSRSDHTHGTQALPTPVAIGASATGHSHVESDITSLVTDLAAKAPLASPTFTGTPTLPTGSVATTQSAGNSTTAIATTAFVTTADNLKANLAGPTFTGVPAAPTATPGTNTTQLATTAFVAALGALKANLAGPALTGVPTAPTAAQGVNTTQLATTAYVQTEVGLLVPKSLMTTKGDILAATASATPARLGVGADGTFLKADSSQVTGLIWATPTVTGGGGGSATGYESGVYPNTGWWYRAPGDGAVGANATGTVGRGFFVPFVLAVAKTFDRIGIDVAVASGATGVARLGIFANSASGTPGTLILDAGTVAVDTTGGKAITISQLLQPGLYWLAVAGQVAGTVQYRATVAGQKQSAYFSGANMFVAAEAGVALAGVGITGAFASNPTITDNDRGAIIGLRAA